MFADFHFDWHDVELILRLHKYLSSSTALPFFILCLVSLYLQFKFFLVRGTYKQKYAPVGRHASSSTGTTPEEVVALPAAMPQAVEKAPAHQCDFSIVLNDFGK